VFLATDWIMIFRFSLVCGKLCGDGFSVIIQSQSKDSLASCTFLDSWCHGYRRIAPSFAVIFNAEMKSSISFAFNGDNPMNDFSIPSTVEFSDGGVHEAKLHYDFSRKKLEVYLDDYLETSYIFSTNERSLLENEAFVGFGGHNGAIRSSTISIFSWQYGIPSLQPTFCQIIEDKKRVGYIGEEFSIHLQTYNSCKQLRIFNDSTIQVYFEHIQSKRRIESSRLEYAGSGSYIIWASLPFEGFYKVFLTQNNEKQYDVGSIKIL
jgi:hypothetical protein